MTKRSNPAVNAERCFKKSALHKSHPLPCAYIAKANKLDQASLSALDDILHENAIFGEWGKLMFLFCLDAQGKEYVPHLQKMFAYTSNPVMFISSNFEKFPHKDRFLYCSDDKCKRMACALGVLDPLGGGSYPLNYLFVIDSSLKIRCKLPVKYGTACSGYQRFGVDLPQLHAIVAEYLAWDTFIH